MQRASLSAVLAALAALGLAPGPAKAQTTCPEGRTLGGQCVNAAMAEALRQTAIIFSQPKLSQTHYPVLPVDDRRFRYPNELNPDSLKPGAAGTPVPPPPPPPPPP